MRWHPLHDVPSPSHVLRDPCSSKPREPSISARKRKVLRQMSDKTLATRFIVGLGAGALLLSACSSSSKTATAASSAPAAAATTAAASAPAAATTSAAAAPASSAPAAPASAPAAASSAAAGGVPSWCGPKKISFGLTDGFGGNSWRLVTTAAAKQEAAKCPSVTAFSYADGQGNTQKAISDIQGMVAKGVNAMVVFPDAGPAILPALHSAFAAGVVTVPYRAQRAVLLGPTTTSGSVLTSPTTARTGQTGF